METEVAKNVLGGKLQICGKHPKTGFYRKGCCETGPEDSGQHVVCAVVTNQFLEFSKSRGNDLLTPRPTYDFPGLKAGDRWCLCALRWKEAYEAGAAPPVVLEATHKAALRYLTLKSLLSHAYTLHN
ncbi:MAG: DUF2237 domain-containing protein [Cyclobacteriaceae bacterium]